MPRPKSRRVFSKEFKLQVINDVDGGMSIAEAANSDTGAYEYNSAIPGAPIATPPPGITLPGFHRLPWF